MAGRPDVVKPGMEQWALALACALLLALKLWLVSRLNINWDEFFYLSQVHSAARGELTQALQTGFVHLFAWLPWIGGDEVAQVNAARVVMVFTLGISAILIQRLALNWFPPVAAWAAALAFLALWPTFRHGGSFRADSMLLPLQLGVLVVLANPRFSDRGRGISAGFLLGLAVVISIKAVLLAPVVGAFGWGRTRDWRQGLKRLVWLAGAALLAAIGLIALHSFSTAGAGEAAAAGSMAQRAWQKTLADSPWFPQMGTLVEMLQEDRIIWLIAAAGLLWAAWLRLWLVVACALALLPIVFYRNSYPYFYVVMWGPASITIAAAVAALRELSARVARPAISRAVTLALVALLGAQGLRDLPFLSQPRQDAQRQLVAAVHSIFPEPVAYIDHSGMIASFRKANFFMSTWGVESYVARGQAFMPKVMSRFRPPLLISNRAELLPGTGSYQMLLAQDRDLIEAAYQPYWGPIRVAGAAVTLNDKEPAAVHLPFAGRYRLEAPVPVLVSGAVLHDGEVVNVRDEQLTLEVGLEASAPSAGTHVIRLLWAEARPPPEIPPVSLSYFDGL